MSDDTPAVAAPRQQPTTFTRASSGLVRQVGTADTFFYGLNVIAISYVVFAIAAWFNYPGSSMWLATLLTAIFGIALCVTYVFLGSAYPRSGGEYVFVSRVVHPVVGFMASVGFSFWTSLYNGLNAAFVAIFGIAPLITVIGLQTKTHGLVHAGAWMGHKWGIFVIGNITMILFALLVTRGIRFWFRIQRWLIIISFVSLTLFCFVLFLGVVGAIDFKSQFDSFAGHGAYAAVLAGGVKAGVNPHPAFSFGQTLDYAIWPAFAIMFTVQAVSFGGEIRNVRRSEMIGITGAMLVGGLIFIILMVFGSGAVGSSFLRAAPATATFPSKAQPYVTTFGYVLAGSPVLTIIIGLWTFLLGFVLMGGGTIYASRGVLAWSIDGMIPRWFGEVSRRHEPVRTILLSLAIGEVGLALYSLTSLLATLAGLLAFVCVFLAVMVAGVMFPFRKRDLYEASAAAYKFLGVPAIVWTSVIGGIASVFLIYRSLTDKSFGANTSDSIRTVVIVFVVAFIWFFVARAIQRRRGVDLDKRFAEVPIE